MSAGNFSELAQALQLAIKSLQMYTAAHPRSEGALEKLNGVVRAWLAAQPKLHVAASAGKVFVDGQPVDGVTVHVTALHRQMSERGVSGFLLKAGVMPRELQALLQLFILKPARIDELGGPEQILRNDGVANIEITQTRYEEIRDGDGGDDSRGPAENPKPRAGGEREEEPELDLELDAGAGAPSLLPDAIRLAALWKQALAEVESAHKGEPGIAKLNLNHLGAVAQDMGMGDSFPNPVLVETLRQAVLALRPETQLGALAGMTSLPATPAGLRMGFQALSPEVFAQAAWALLAGGMPFAELKLPLADIIGSSPQRAAMLSALASLLKSKGIDGGRIQSILQQLDWDQLPFEAKVQKVLREKGFYELTPDQTLRFLRDLLDKGREELFLQVLDAMLQGFAIEEGAPRQNVAEVLAGICHWIMDPGLPQGAEAALADGLKGNFGWEPIPQIHSLSTEGLSAILAAMVYRGELGHAQGLLQELRDLVAFMEEDSREWREKALQRLQGWLGQEGLVNRAVREAVDGGQSRLLTEIIPYLEFLGPAGAEGVVRNLGDEPDRQRRGRLMDIIRAMGPLVLDSLGTALRSPTWFMVRNALNLLGELGDAGLLPDVIGCMNHADGRVRRAAVRAAWKLGGPGAEPALMQLLPRTDPDTQMEVLFALGQIKSVASVPVLTEFIRERRAQDRLRHKAIEILGQLGHGSGIPVLADLFKRKGFSLFATPVEPPEIRVAAAKALAAIGGPEATAVLKQALANEAKGPDRSAMESFLRPGPR
jgi:hypothetical protein